MCNTPAVLLWSCRNTRWMYLAVCLCYSTVFAFFLLWATFIFPSPSSFDRLLLWLAAVWPNDDFASDSCASFLFSLLLPRGKQLLTVQKPDYNRCMFDTPTVDSLQVWKAIYICTPLLFTKTSKSPKISTMVNDCLAVRDSHQHRLQHLSPGSEVTCIYICVLYIYILYDYVCYDIYIYICVCARAHIHAVKWYLSIWSDLSIYLALCLPFDRSIYLSILSYLILSYPIYLSIYLQKT